MNKTMIIILALFATFKVSAAARLSYTATLYESVLPRLIVVPHGPLRPIVVDSSMYGLVLLCPSDKGATLVLIDGHFLRMVGGKAMLSCEDGLITYEQE